jgi:DNA-binding winged helix-turn-helix (wHTH) protein
MQDPLTSSPFLIGDWVVDARRREIARGGYVRVLEPRHVDVLCALAVRAGHVVSAGELLDLCWAGGFLGDNPVHKAVAMLRRALGDDAKAPRYIATVRKRGYRVIAPVRARRAPGERLERALLRWGHRLAFQRRMRGLGPNDEHDWHALAAALLRVATSLAEGGAYTGALGAVDEARGWLVRLEPLQSTKNACVSAPA